MGAEVGATTSTFGYDESMERYLRATGRDDVANAANKITEIIQNRTITRGSGHPFSS